MKIGTLNHPNVLMKTGYSTLVFTRHRENPTFDIKDHFLGGLERKRDRVALVVNFCPDVVVGPCILLSQRQLTTTCVLCCFFICEEKIP